MINHNKMYLNWGCKDLPNSASSLEPLYKLSIKKMFGGSAVKKLLEKVKGFYSHPNILCIMVPPPPLIIDCDASPSHNYQDNFEKPVVYTSRTLSQAEKLFTNLKRVFGSYKHFFKRTLWSFFMDGVQLPQGL